MSEEGHQRKSARVWARSVHPSTADVRGQRQHVRKPAHKRTHAPQQNHMRGWAVIRSPLRFAL